MNGREFTVMVVLLEQPVAGNDVVIVTEPGLPGVTIPDEEPILAIGGTLLLQITPGELVNVIVLPIHTLEGPVIGAGNGLTVTTMLVLQPEDNV